MVGRRILLAPICEEDEDKYLTRENISEKKNKIGPLTGKTASNRGSYIILALWTYGPLFLFVITCCFFYQFGVGKMERKGDLQAESMY